MSLLCLKGSKVAPPEVPLEDQVAQENAAFPADASFDLASRERLKEGMEEQQIYTPEENAIIAEGQLLFAMKESGNIKMAPVTVDSPLLKDAAAFVNADDHFVCGSSGARFGARPSRTSSRTITTLSRSGLKSTG